MNKLTSGQFAKGFVASLVTNGTDSIQPKSEVDRKGFRKALEVVEQEIATLKRSGKEEDTQLYRALVTLRAELAPSNAGTFDSFEAALRNLQLSFTSCPNPFYEDIQFTVSTPYASSVLEEFETNQKSVIDRAAKAFLEARSNT